MAFLYAAKVDNSTLSIQTIDYPHHEIHEGDSFFVAEVTDLGNGASRTLVIITPNTTKWSHFELGVNSEAEVSVTLTESVTVSGGTAITPVNRNRNSANTAGMIVKHTPDSASGGTDLITQQFGSGRGIGGESRDIAEIILKQNTTYTVVCTNKTTGNNLVNITLNWYEHAEKV